MGSLKEYSGWLFDLYAHPRMGVVLWLAGEDGRRHYLRQDFQTTFYASGVPARLRAAWRWLSGKPVRLAHTQRRDLYTGPLDVLEVQVASPSLHAAIFNQLHAEFPELDYYDADLPLSLRYAAAFQVFPLAYCRVTTQSDGTILRVSSLDDPWQLNPRLPALRELHLEPDCNPSRSQPKELLVEYAQFKYRLPMDQPRRLLSLLGSILRNYDPDVLLTNHGDTWLLDHLEMLSTQTGIPLNFNRDLAKSPEHRKEISFFNYGRAHHRGKQVHLFGRWHIDRKNCMTYGEYGLAGAIEQARVTGLPVQEVARRSPGAGISAMQTITALRDGVLSPYQGQRGEAPKTYVQLFKADRGGLVFEPLLGVFPNVAVLDFISMYPSVMIEYNISPETVAVNEPDAWEIPGLDLKVSARTGLIPRTLRPMRDKRVQLKRLLKEMEADDPRRGRYQAMSKALKWLSVVAYGRLGYANSTFGRINSHEAVTYVGRMILIQAKTIAEEHGFTVLHLYVDSLFLYRPGASQPADFQPVIQAIEEETRLPLEFEGLYPWMAFLGRRAQPGIPVANRFFGFQGNGEHKIRGIALRREDTPPFVAAAQMQLLDLLAQEKDPERLPGLLPEALRLIRHSLEMLEKEDIPLEQLVVTQTLSRELDQYRVPTPLMRAASQLQQAGRALHMGQRVRYLHARAGTGVAAWDLTSPGEQVAIDVSRYKALFFRAALEILQPLGVTEEALRDWVFGGAGYLQPPGTLQTIPLPLFARLRQNMLYLP